MTAAPFATRTTSLASMIWGSKRKSGRSSPPSSSARGPAGVRKIIAVGGYVWAHVNFLNLFNDDPNDKGIAGVDIYKMDADGRAIEHWDTLQRVGDQKDSVP